MDEKRPIGKSRMGFYLAWTAFLILLYVLSYGPLMWAMMEDYVSPTVVRIFFAPLYWVVHVFPPLGQLLDWWRDKWFQFN